MKVLPKNCNHQIRIDEDNLLQEVLNICVVLTVRDVFRHVPVCIMCVRVPFHSSCLHLHGNPS